MMAARYLSVKNFERFQHYRDRTPPWIKLYNDLLDDYAFACLQDASKAHLVLIWLLASRYENRVPNDPEWIARKIGATTPVDIAALVSAGFVTVEQDASTPLAASEQPATPEVEREIEVESPPSGEAPAHVRRARRGPLSHFVPDTWSPTEAHRKKAAELAVNLEAEAQAFRLHEFNTPHSDWGRAFSKWLLRAPGFTNGNGSAASHANGGGETTADRLRREGDARDRREALDAAKRAQLNTWGLEVERRLNAASAEVRERIEAAAELSVGTARVPEVVRSKALRTARLRLYGAEIGSPMPEVGQ
jgi:hypothetical protein